MGIMTPGWGERDAVSSSASARRPSTKTLEAPFWASVRAIVRPRPVYGLTTSAAGDDGDEAIEGKEFRGVEMGHFEQTRTYTFRTKNKESEALVDLIVMAFCLRIPQ
ncbi:hypothetical protein TMatcc_007292 [Talaromyces marneffei ATCC 18224]